MWGGVGWGWGGLNCDFSPLETTWLLSKSARKETRAFGGGLCGEEDRGRALRSCSHACSPTASTDTSRISITSPVTQHWHFYRRRCEEHLVPLQQQKKNPHPGVQRKSDRELRSNRSYFARPFPLRSSGVPGWNFYKLPPLAKWRNLPLQPLVISGFFFSPFLSTTFPRYYPPFFPVSPPPPPL